MKVIAGMDDQKIPMNKENLKRYLYDGLIVIAKYKKNIPDIILKIVDGKICKKKENEWTETDIPDLRKIKEIWIRRDEVVDIKQ